MCFDTLLLLVVGEEESSLDFGLVLHSGGFGGFFLPLEIWKGFFRIGGGRLSAGLCASLSAVKLWHILKNIDGSHIILVLNPLPSLSLQPNFLYSVILTQSAKVGVTCEHVGLPREKRK